MQEPTTYRDLLENISRISNVRAMMVLEFLRPGSVYSVTHSVG